MSAAASKNGSRPPGDGVRAVDLTKRYPDGTTGAGDICLSGNPGEIIGVVGPNGAGKSTILNMLATLIRPTSGEAWIGGRSIYDVDTVRATIGVALQDVGIDPLMSGREHFLAQAALYRISAARARQRGSELLGHFDLETHADRPAGLYSGGMQRRLSLALALVHDPKTIIFDEPTVGLDPQSRSRLWGLLEEVRDAGKTTILSTQYLQEADLLCDRIYVIADGSVLAEGQPAELKARVGSVTVRVRVGGSVDQAASAIGRELPDLTAIEVEDHRVVVRAPASGDAPRRILGIVDREGLGLAEFIVSEPTLEDVFLHYTGDAPASESLERGGLDASARTHRGGGKLWK